MSKEYARSFYKSSNWLHCKASFIAERRAIDGGLCQRCHKQYGYIVHHKKHITPENISDISVILNHNNLEFLCHDCHNKEHHRNDKKKRYAFDEAGNLISPPIRSKFREGSTPRAGG